MKGKPFSCRSCLATSFSKPLPHPKALGKSQRCLRDVPPHGKEGAGVYVRACSIILREKGFFFQSPRERVGRRVSQVCAE